MIILLIQLVNLLRVFPVPVSNVSKVILQLLLLLLKRRVQIALSSEVPSESRGFHIAVVKVILLPLKVDVKIAILLFSISKNSLLVVDFIPEVGDED